MRRLVVMVVTSGWLRRKLDLESVLMLMLWSRWRRSPTLLLPRAILTMLGLSLSLGLGLRVSVDRL